ncbi:MAG: DUF6111 family protein [Rhodospirillales bacterium]|nr:DUF6111 family protein [Rhodospirillales bacterium]MCW8863204.1 DUF6111 family protein [Rhodospirillales bacterium]MCW8952996.1 DUF6111 family protein [Rhodospirillales bacterium]MCW8969849.1 DUF6111 family protein [Rhodospirillales bacterium]MCW9002070.1 DUF6111 family protein [Rhodospirillales bacterium]
MRILLQYILPFLAPLALYLAWFFLWGRRHEKALPDWKSGPWFWLIIAGFLLAASGLVFMSFSGDDPGGVYHAPRYEDGRIIPGHVK